MTLNGTKFGTLDFDLAFRTSPEYLFGPGLRADLESSPKLTTGPRPRF